MKRILIIKTSAIGDVIQALVMLGPLQAAYPQAEIDWISEKPSYSLLASHPKIANALAIDTKRWKKQFFSLQTYKEIFASIQKLRSTHYDLVIDAQGNTKSGLITLLSRGKSKVGFDRKNVSEIANLLATNQKVSVAKGKSSRETYLSLVPNADEIDPRVRLTLSAEEQKRLSALSLCTKPNIMVCPFSKWKNKQLYPETLLSLLKKIDDAHQPRFFFVYSSEKEKLYAEQLSTHFPSSIILGAMSLPLWQAVMWKMDLVLAMDSAALHLCATTDTPSFSIFGPSLGSYYAPPGHKHLQGTCPYGRTFAKRCPILRSCPTGACMETLSASELFESLSIQRKETYSLDLS